MTTTQDRDWDRRHQHPLQSRTIAKAKALHVTGGYLIERRVHATAAPRVVQPRRAPAALAEEVGGDGHVQHDVVDVVDVRLHDRLVPHEAVHVELLGEVAAGQGVRVVRQLEGVLAEERACTTKRGDTAQGHASTTDW